MLTEFCLLSVSVRGENRAGGERERERRREREREREKERDLSTLRSLS